MTHMFLTPLIMHINPNIKYCIPWFSSFLVMAFSSIPRTPEKKNQDSSVKTPVKSNLSIQFSPRSSEHLCVLCGKDFPSANDRRLLFKAGSSSAICKTLEEIVCQEILPGNTTNVICRYCVGRIDTVRKKLDKIKSDFSHQQENFRHRFGRETFKRTQPGVDLDSEETQQTTKRKSLGPLFCSVASPGPGKRNVEVQTDTSNQDHNEGISVSFITVIY